LSAVDRVVENTPLDSEANDRRSAEGLRILIPGLTSGVAPDR